MIVYVQNDPYKKSGLGTLVFMGIACFFKRKRAIPSCKRANSFFTLFVKSDESKSLFPKEGITPVTLYLKMTFSPVALYLKSKWFYPIALLKWATRAKEQIPNPVKNDLYSIKNDLYSIKNDLFKICPYKKWLYTSRFGQTFFSKERNVLLLLLLYIFYPNSGLNIFKRWIIHNKQD